MKITKTPDMLRGAIGSGSASSFGGVVIVGQFPTSTSSNLGIISSSSNTASWQPIISTITADGTLLTGPHISLSAGSNITFSLTSNTVFIHGRSFGSNTNDVSSVGAVGASSSNSRADHVHRGVTSLAHASNTLYGAITLTTPGNTVGITSPTAGTLALSVLGVSSISHTSNTFYGALTLTTPGNTVGITHPSAGTLALTAVGGGGGGGGGSVSADAIWDAKGDIAAGTAADTAVRLAVGTDGQALTADSSTTTGLKWAAIDDPVADVFGAADTAYEFATTSLTGLTAIGSATAEDANTTVPGHYYVRRAATSAVALTGRYAATPATPFTAICKLSDHTFVASNYQRAGGLFVGQATPGVLEAIHVIYNAGVTIAHERYTNPTTFNASIGTNRLIGATSFPLYYGVVVNSTTDVDFWFSFGGRVWQKRTDARNPAITIGSVGIVVDPEHATYGVTGAYDFLRIWNSAKTFPGS